MWARILGLVKVRGTNGNDMVALAGPPTTGSFVGIIIVIGSFTRCSESVGDECENSSREEHCDLLNFGVSRGLLYLFNDKWHISSRFRVKVGACAMETIY